MAQTSKEGVKRKAAQPDENPSVPKKIREDDSYVETVNGFEKTAGKILKIFLRNFMCHESMEICLNQNVNFIVGRNGSGKSAILTALAVGLGAKAVITNRGSSIKEFIKKGKSNATVEITLTNTGVNAYNPELFGNTITVCRSFGASCTYRIKNELGKTIYTKKSELDTIMHYFNIQVDNPICVLNQDVSRTFLIVSDASKKYQLFMKATQLDVIYEKYNESQMYVNDAFARLAEAKEFLKGTEKEIDNIKKNIETLQSLDSARNEVTSMSIEVMWAKVMEEEKMLRKLQVILKTAKDHVDDLICVEEQKDAKEKEYDDKIEQLENKIAEEESKNVEKKSTFNQLKAELTAIKTRYSEKAMNLNNLNSAINRRKRDILQLKEAIQKIERERSDVEASKNEMKAKYELLKNNLDDIEALIQTKQVEKRHLENDRTCLEQERHSLKGSLDNSKNSYDKLRKQLHSLQQQSDQAMTVYGHNMPRLLRRINEEYKKGNFKEKPIGPLGAYIKLKDKEWVPAVESFLGGMVRSFCTDNAEDTKQLRLIMREVFHGERSPQIISSKFYKRIHDTSKRGCFSPDYSNMLDAMDISEPVVANCLIDQREIESILLIPTNQEACRIMSQQRFVPRNCKRAITQNADLYFPDPNYRTYGGRCGSKPRFLQVSTAQAIQTLKEELAVASSTQEKAEQQYNAIMERLRSNETECHNVSRFINENLMRQRELKIMIEKIEDETTSRVLDDLSVLTNDLQEHEQKLKEEEEQGLAMKTEIESIKKELENKSSEWKKAREELQNFDLKMFPFRDEIKVLKDTKETLKFNSKKASNTLKKARNDVQKADVEMETQCRFVKKLTEDATKKSPRIETNRTVKDLESKIKDLNIQIKATEKQCGSKENMEAELEEKVMQYNKIIETVERLNNNIQKQMERLKVRKTKYATLRNQIGQKVQHAFEKILSLRKYKGTIHIDHKQLTLELEVSPANDAQRKTNDAKTLSGGERSYSTVAFILALWDCTGLPFYFLDEFDVFMDKVNRRVIMDILLQHTKLYPQRQFGFLTPLDASHIKADQYISIHQLAPPERQGESENE